MCSSLFQRLREENQQLKDQLESEEEGQVNETRKGNSLFSEVMAQITGMGDLWF